ncbi:MAG: WYL domain-containing protein [Propionibacteriaceae bacterium]|nr:WYL domain-containing protein [Propionibacteriaceae bacterium]
MTAAPQVARLLILVPYLQQREYVDVAEVAADFNIKPRQVLDDLQVLVMCGLPGGLPDDLIEIDLDLAREEGLIHMRNSPLTRPLRFTRDEAVSLIVAVEAVREVADGPTAQAAQSVIDKLSGLMGEALPVRLEVAAGGDDVRDRLGEAIDQGLQVRLTYDGLARRGTTTPVVDPTRVEVRDGASYLVAWALDRGDWRSYRLDRIADAELTGQPAKDHGAPPVASGSFEDTPDTATLDLDASAAWVAEYYPVRGVTALPDGGVQVVLPVADPGFLTGLILRLGPQIRFVDPPSAAADALAEARAFLGQLD